MLFHFSLINSHWIFGYIRTLFDVCTCAQHIHDCWIFNLLNEMRLFIGYYFQSHQFEMRFCGHICIFCNCVRCFVDLWQNKWIFDDAISCVPLWFPQGVNVLFIIHFINIYVQNFIQHKFELNFVLKCLPTHTRKKFRFAFVVIS